MVERLRGAGAAPVEAVDRGWYRSAIDAWIKPIIGNVPLKDLDRDDLTRLYRTLREKGCRSMHREKMRPLGSRSVQLVHTIMTKALASAVADDKVPASPMDRVHPDQRPTHTPRKLADRHWTPEEARTFLNATGNDRLHPLWALALDTGARRGELAGLRWSHVDLDAGVVSIERSGVMVGGQVIESTPKSAKSHRRVDLQPQTVAALRRWRKAQAEERLAAGPAWAGGDDPYLFTDELGDPYRPATMSEQFEEAQAKVDVPVLTFHGLRHTSATIALDTAVPVHVVSKRLGHASVSITMDTYAHALPDQATDAALRIGGALYGTEAAR